MAGVESALHLEGFVPRLLDAHFAGATQTSDGEAQHLDGIVLFVDIVESTLMTDRIAAAGPDGAELLGTLLNAYFTSLIEIVASFGGDVIRIDGDAIIAFWTTPDGSLRSHMRAAKAALAVRDVRTVWPVEPQEPVRQRIVLVTGRFATLVLSGRTRRNFLVFAGERLGIIGRIMRNGEPGDVILDDRMARLLAPMATTEPVEAAEPAAWPAARLARLESAATASQADGEIPDSWAMASVAQAGAFVPQVILERGVLNLSDWLAEFRVVSVVYARIGESDLADRFAADRLRASFETVAKAADAMGVEIFDVVADEKGVVAKIALGLPPFGSEGNAIRAVEIARRIRNEPVSTGAASAVGVATGRIFCGEVGNLRRREYVLSGPVMNYGARLMAAAADDVLCDSETVRVAATRFAFSAQMAIPIRGREAPLSFSCLIKARSDVLPSSTASTMQGRDREFATLLAPLENLASGRGGLIAVQAEPGAGKSRLLAELASEARNRGCLVIEAATDPIERTTAYLMFRSVLQRLLVPQDEAADAPPARLRELLFESLSGTSLLARAALIEDVLPLGIEDHGLGTQIRGAARRDGVVAILVALAKRRTLRQRVLLLADDVQWIDALSANLLLAASARLPEMLVVAASRPPDLAGAPHGARVVSRAHRSLWLPRLDVGATSRVVCDLLQTDTIPRRLAAFVYEQSEGLPIHVEQLVLSLQERGLIEVVDRRCRVTAADLAVTSVPPRLRDIIVGRIDRLEQADQLAVKVASVIGRVVPLATLRDIYPVAVVAAELEASVRRLSAAGILAPAGDAYAFRHTIIHEATYDLLSYAQRRTLHRANAEAIEQRHLAALKPHYPELAHHWEYAADDTRALHYRLLASDVAIRRYANDEALMHTERAGRLAERSHTRLSQSQSVQLAYVRGEAYHGLSQFAEAEAQLRVSLRLSGVRIPISRMHLAVSALLQIALQASHRAGAVARPRAPAKEQRTRLSAHVHTRFAEHAYFMRDSLALVHGSLTALNQAESVNSYPEMIEGYGGLAIGLGTAGMHSVARFYRDRSIRVAERFGGLPDQAFAHLLAGVYSFQAGDWNGTHVFCGKGAGLYERLGDHFRRQSCRVVACFGMIATGEYAGAESGFAEFGPDADTIDNAPVRAWVLAGSSVLDMLRGRPPDRTLARLRLARDSSLHRAERLLCDGLEAAALLRSGDATGAASVAERALEDMRDSVCTVGIAMHSVCAVAAVFLALAGSPDPGRRRVFMPAARAACRAAERYAAQTRICRPLAGLLSARLALLQGRRGVATARMSRARAWADRLGMPLEAAMCQLEGAEMRTGDAARRLHAEGGGATLRRLGANPWRYDRVGADASVAAGL